MRLVSVVSCFVLFEVVANFLKLKGYNEIIQLHLQQHFEHDLARVVAHCRASFAKWRWGTFAECSKLVLSVEPLRQRWHRVNGIRTLFKNAQDGATIKTLNSVMRDDAFWRQLKFMAKVSAMLKDVRVWGGGCACHAVELRQGKDVQCHAKGRRLREVRDRVQEVARSFKLFSDNLDLAEHCSGDQDSRDTDTKSKYPPLAVIVGHNIMLCSCCSSSD